jgi:hypothetical protein
MGSEQKSIRDSVTRKIVLAESFFEKLDAEDRLAFEIITLSLKEMRNEIHGHQSLAFTFNDIKDKPRFVLFNFLELNEDEIKLYSYDDITSDGYLDMLLEDKVLRTKYTEHETLDY